MQIALVTPPPRGPRWATSPASAPYLMGPRKERLRGSQFIKDGSTRPETTNNRTGVFPGRCPWLVGSLDGGMGLNGSPMTTRVAGVGFEPGEPQCEFNNEITHYIHCPYLLSSETTAKGTGLEKLAGKEDPVELDSSLAL